jgi:predicted GNAT superfamily acetyltransferase
MSVARYFFACLFAQSELRLLGLRRCQTDLDHGEFLGFVRRFVFGLPLMALDLSRAFDKSAFTEFVRSLAEAVWMRRLSLANSAGGGEVAATLADILPGLAELSEVAADCLRPTLPVFYRIWEVIAKHPSIHASDFPTCRDSV